METRSASKFTITWECGTQLSASPTTRWLILGLILFSAISADAFDPLDPNGNITIKWDIMSWTGDGYVATVSLSNYQLYRQIQSPGWRLGWTWAKKEIIWSMVGGEATDQGDCSRYNGNIPYCCMKSPTIIDLMPGTPYNQQIANCCRGGVISAYAQDPATSVAAFQVSAGSAGTSAKSVRLPKNFTLNTPGPGYTCSPAKVVKPSQFISQDGRRSTQALMTWKVTCTYSQFIAQRAPSCCASFSSFYNDTIVPCPVCSCGCQDNIAQLGNCIKGDSPYLKTPGINTPQNNTPLIQCTPHMCPIRIHWHVKLNYQLYWRVKVTITNFNYRMNYSNWNIVLRHPNFDNLTEVFSFNYKPLIPYGSLNDTALFWGIKYFNDMLMEDGSMGNVQSEMLLQKDMQTFTFKQGWAFPRTVYFNGDECVMPAPDAYPTLPNSTPVRERELSLGLIILVLAVTSLLVFI